MDPGDARAFIRRVGQRLSQPLRHRNPAGAMACETCAADTLYLGTDRGKGRSTPRDLSRLMFGNYLKSWCADGIEGPSFEPTWGKLGVITDNNG